MNSIIEILENGIKQLISDKYLAEWSRDNAERENKELKARISELENKISEMEERANDTF